MIWDIIIILLLFQICLVLTNIKIEIRYNNILFEEQIEKKNQNKEDE